MFLWLPESEGTLVSLKLVGRFTEADVEAVLPKLVHVIETGGTLRLVADLSSFDGWEWRAAWDQEAFGIKHWKDVHKIALLGTLGWAVLVARLAATITTAQVRVFEDHDKALFWARGEEA
jgi:hypothetical protein